MSKFLGFLLGVAVALAGPAVFGVLEAPGGIELNTKEMALAFGIGALIFWAVVSYFSGAGALGAFVAFGVLIYCWLWIPNRTTNFLNDVPGVTTGMIDGSKQYTLNGVVPILAVISLVYGIQLIVRSTQRRRRERVEAERLQREQEAVQAQQEADAAALYPVAGSTYAGQYGESYSNSSFDELFGEEREPVRPRNQADDQTSQFPAATAEHTAQLRENGAPGNYPGDDTVLVPTDRDETVQVPATPPAEQPEAAAKSDEPDDPEDGEPTGVAAPAADQSAAPEAPEPQQEKPAAVAEQPPAAPKQPAPEPPIAEQSTPATPEPPQEKAVSADDEPTAAPQQPVEAPKVAPEQPPAAAAAEKQPQTEQPQAPVPGADATQAVPTPPAKAEQAPEPDADDDATQEAPRVEPQAAPTPPAKAEREERAASSAPATKEQVGSQYRERMDDPEDTGEIHLTAFENPVVRPAGA